MSTEIITADSTAVSTLSAVPTVAVADFQREMYNAPVNRLAERLRKDGKVDTVLHAGFQIKTEELNGKVLTIVHLGYSTAPSTTMSGEPIFRKDKDGNIITDENGVAIQEMSVFPVAHFAEAPGWWWNGGTMLAGVIDSLRAECGDEPGDMLCPKLNAELDSIGGLRAYFSWKTSTKHPGQRYMNIAL